MQSTGLIYTLSRNTALNAITDIRSNDVLLLSVLYLHNKPLAYFGLYHYLQGLGYARSYHSFTDSLSRCIEFEYIIRERIGNNVTYTLTYSGRAILDRVNTKLDQCVKELIMKFGNGFE